MEVAVARQSSRLKYQTGSIQKKGKKERVEKSAVVWDIM
jgi:hypothetical protein